MYIIQVGVVATPSAIFEVDFSTSNGLWRFLEHGECSSYIDLRTDSEDGRRIKNEKHTASCISVFVRIVKLGQLYPNG